MESRSTCNVALPDLFEKFRAFASRLFTILLLFFLPACATPPLPEESEPVVALMAERLSLAHDIAWTKWADGLPVRDPVRENALVERLTKQGVAGGFEEEMVIRFVKAQIEASCMEQEAWMAKWRKDTPLPPGEPPTLESLRMKIDRISQFMVAEWAAASLTPPAPARAYLLKYVTNPRSAEVAALGFTPDANSAFRRMGLR